jgi:predicted DNA-binding protein
MSFDIPDRPKRKYVSKDKKKEKVVLSIRVPEELRDRLKEISGDKGYSLAELMETILDQYCQFEDKQK